MLRSSPFYDSLGELQKKEKKILQLVLETCWTMEDNLWWKRSRIHESAVGVSSIIFYPKRWRMEDTMRLTSR